MQAEAIVVLTTRRADTLRVALVAAQRAQRIGGRMRELRAELGLTQPEVADRMGVASVTKDYIHRWESARVEPSEDYLVLLADALETTVADLMAGPVADRRSVPTETPDAFAAPGDGAAVRAALAAIETRLDRIDSTLATVVVPTLGELRADAEGRRQSRRRTGEESAAKRSGEAA